MIIIGCSQARVLFVSDAMEVRSRVENKASGLAGLSEILNGHLYNLMQARSNFERPSVQFDANKIKFWVAIVENCTENGQWPAVIFSCEGVGNPVFDSLVPSPALEGGSGAVCKLEVGLALHHITSPNRCHSCTIHSHVATTMDTATVIYVW